MQKATVVNRRRNAASPMPKRIWHQVTKDRRSNGSLDRGRVLDLSGIKIGSLESAILRIGSSAEAEDLIFKKGKGRQNPE